MGINNVAVDWVLEVGRKRCSERQDNAVEIFESLGGSRVDRFREVRFDTACRISGVVSRPEAKVEVFHPGYQEGSFDVKGESISLFHWVSQRYIFAMRPLT